MGKPTGFLEYDRCERAKLPVRERIKNFNEFYAPFNQEERRRQGARCMNCGVPLCQSGMTLGGMVSGCPLHNLIPEWNDAVYNGNYQHALSRLLKTNNFPEFTGRVCPALCEKACICGRDGEPVTVHDNELFIIETAFANGQMTPRTPPSRTDKRVAVVGSGPSGLTVADMLNRRGHNVTVYEKQDRPGGLLMYGIPNMKLDKSVVMRRVRLMEEEGVRFELGVDVGADITAEQILADYDAVVLCCGAGRPRSIPAAESMPDGVYYAVDYLAAATRSLLDPDYEPISALNKNVVIVGGGDTGNDCVGTCIRQGCRSVVQLEMMPCPPLVRQPSNPWPEWPKCLKTDYGQQEAAELFGADPRIYSTTVSRLVTDEGRLRAIVTVQLESVTENGKRSMRPVEGSEKELPAEILLIAAGFTGCCEYVPEAFGVDVSDRGRVVTDGGFYTGIDKVFSAGDMRRGQSLVVWAISEGRACAAAVDRFLMGYSNMI